MSRMRIIIAVIGFGGALLFGAAFAASYARPAFVEELAANVIRAEVEQRVGERIAALQAGPMGGLAAIVAQRNAAEIERARRLLADSLAVKVARVAAEMRDPACACRTPAAIAMAAGLADWRTFAASRAGERLTALIRVRYLEVAAGLTREFRIFTAANALVLLVLGIAAVARRNARLHLLPPAMILACAAVVIGWFYLFRQDWLHAILFSDFVGLAYFAYLGTAALLLGDVLLNRGRVTARAINTGVDIVGGAFTVAPC